MDSDSYDRIGRKAMEGLFVWLVVMTAVLAGASWVWFALIAAGHLLIGVVAAWRSSVLETP